MTCAGRRQRRIGFKRSRRRCGRTFEVPAAAAVGLCPWCLTAQPRPQPRSRVRLKFAMATGPVLSVRRVGPDVSGSVVRLYFAVLAGSEWAAGEHRAIAVRLPWYDLRGSGWYAGGAGLE